MGPQGFGSDPFGIATIAFGLMIIYYLIRIFIPKEKKPSRKEPDQSEPIKLSENGRVIMYQ